MVFYMFVCLSRYEADALFVEGVHILNNYCVTVYGSILILFLPFFGRDCPFRIDRVLIFVASWREWS